MNTTAPTTSISEARPDEECYPKAGSHVWNEFAGLAIELGGYGDITAIDPYTGRRFWWGNGVLTGNFYEDIRNLATEMEKQRFLARG